MNFTNFPNELPHVRGGDIRPGVIGLLKLDEEAQEQFECPTFECRCPSCGRVVGPPASYEELQCYSCQDYWSPSERCPAVCLLDKDGYRAVLKCRPSGVSDDILFTVILEESPYFTLAEPTAFLLPGCGAMDKPSDTGPPCRCFGHEWFAEGAAPYPVYSAATGERIPPSEPSPEDVG